jgi:NitT/TauT family transport system substrate-binding protein
MNEIDILTTKEAADMLRLSPAAIHKLKREGKLPFVRLGRKVFFKKSTLQNFVSESEQVNNPGVEE